MNWLHLEEVLKEYEAYLYLTTAPQLPHYKQNSPECIFVKNIFATLVFLYCNYSIFVL